MPRPKVRPEDRRRSVRACDTCKHLKKRCDSEVPCTPCTRKGIAGTCVYTGRSSRHPGSSRRGIAFSGARVASAYRSLSSLHHKRDEPAATAPATADRTKCGLRHPGDTASHLAEEADQRSYQGRTTAEDLKRENSPHPEGQKPVMLFSSSGEKVFVGNTAALSFHHFLRKILKRYAGPSNFTESQSRRMLEVDIPDSEDGSFHDSLDEEEKRALIQHFLDASCGLLDLFIDPEIENLLRLAVYARDHGPKAIKGTQREDLAAFYAILAIGAQCRGLGSSCVNMQENGNEESNEESGGSDRERDSVDDQSTAARYFSRARHLAFEGMLQDPTTQMARTFLLLAFFMFGACRRNTAFMFIGVASKAAVVLGLHVSAQYQHLAPTERDLRLRTGKSIRALDLVCSSILGRPGSTLSLRADDVYASDLAGGRGDAEATPRHRALALSATYEASMVLESIVHQAARDGEHNSSVNMAPATAENFLQMLREWSQALPSALRRGPPREERARGDGGMDEPNRRDREACVGNIHVACTYYFGVILTTRHFLIQHTMPLLRRKPAHQQSGASTPSVASGGGWDGKQGHATTPSSSSAKVSEMAHVCIDAAVYMAQMCAEASDGGILLGNMCILKAWLFAAGLVLGFSLLSDAPTSTQLRERDAFDGSRRVLAQLGRLSPQAAQYHEMLSSFADAIEHYRARLARDQQRQAPSVPLVERILSLGPTAGAASTAGCTTSPSSRHEQRQQRHQRHKHRVEETTNKSPALPGVESAPDLETPNSIDSTPTSWSDILGTPSLLDFPAPSGEDEVMLNLFWDGYAMNFGEIQGPQVDLGLESPSRPGTA